MSPIPPSAKQRAEGNTNNSEEPAPKDADSELRNRREEPAKTTLSGRVVSEEAQDELRELNAADSRSSGALRASNGEQGLLHGEESDVTSAHGALIHRRGDSAWVKLQKTVAKHCGLKYHQDLRTLLIVGIFYCLVGFRWKRFFMYKARLDAQGGTHTAATEPSVVWRTRPDGGRGSVNPLYGSLDTVQYYGMPSLLEDCIWQCLTCTFAFFCATIVHNCMHTAQFVDYHVNTLWHVILSNAYGHPVSTLVPGHNLSHHKYTQTNMDIHRTMRLRKGEPGAFMFITYFWRCLPTIMRADAKYFRVAAEKLKERESNNSKFAGRSTRPVWRFRAEQAFFYGPAVLLAYFYGLKTWFWIMFIPQIMAKNGLISVNLCQHDGCLRPGQKRGKENTLDPDDGSDEWEPEYNMARDFTGFWLNFWTCNNGYHSPHHWRPSAHWTKLPQLHKEIFLDSGKQHPRLNQPNLLAYGYNAWFSNWGWGRRERYDGRPYFPVEEDVDEDWVDDFFAGGMGAVGDIMRLREEAGQRIASGKIGKAEKEKVKGA